MSRKFKSQASSARAASTFTSGTGFGSSFQATSSPLSYVTEPPDLSQISDSNVVVAFKNLNKKDSVTKGKALEEIQEYCSSVQDVEEAVLIAWADIYPRTAIDNSRRVRQVAHSLQGNLTSSAGKRIASLLPKLVGAWLAGTFDADKIVSRSALDALQKSFSSQEKVRTLWKAYRSSLLEYVEDAITVQTRSTLSDERTTSADDAEAKYVRVIGTAIHVLSVLLKDEGHEDIITGLLSDKKIWEFVFNNDSYLRRASSGLVLVASDKRAECLDWNVISTCFISKGLQSDQSGSALQFSEALITLTKRRPQLWTADYAARTSVTQRLHQFLRKGSQNGSENVWRNLSILLKILPEPAWLGEDELVSAEAVAEAIRTGVTSPSERPNVSAAWKTYVEVCFWLIERLASCKHQFAARQLVPLVVQYVTRAEDQSWAVGVQPQQICQTVLRGVISAGCIEVFEEAWSRVTDQTIELMKLSLPESSKEFRTSQDAVASQSHRYFGVRTALLNPKIGSAEALLILQELQSRILSSAIDLLVSRNGKPYSAAIIVREILRQVDTDRTDAKLQQFLRQDLNDLVESPSAEYAVSIAVENSETNVIDRLLQAKSAHAQQALLQFLRIVRADALGVSAQEHLKARFASLVTSDSLDIVSAILTNRELPDLQKEVAAQVQKALEPGSSHEAQSNALALIELGLSTNLSNAILSEANRTLLLSSLLLLSEDESESSSKAAALIQKLTEQAQSAEGSQKIIQQQLNSEGIPLAIFTLLELANNFLKTTSADVNTIMPSDKQWSQALSPLLVLSRPSPLAITSPLQGTVYLLARDSKPDVEQARDADDFVPAFRLALYTTKLLSDPAILNKLDGASIQTLQQYLPLILQLVNENLTLDNANTLWLHSTAEVLQEATDVLVSGNLLIESWMAQEDFLAYWIPKAHQLEGRTSSAYIQALTWVSIIAQYIDRKGPSTIVQEYEQDLKTSSRSKEPLRTCALVAALRESLSVGALGKRISNELVAQATDTKVQTECLILLNILLDGQAEALETLPSQRLVFLLKNLVNLLGKNKSGGIVPECMKLLAAILPLVSDVYGDHWHQILANLIDLWDGDIDLPYLYSSLRLYARIKQLLAQEDSNEDLQEAWSNSKTTLESGLLSCLRVFQHLGLDIDQPRDITADLLRRQLTGVNLRDDIDLYELLSSSVNAVQASAFEILHQAIPKHQEQLSLDLVLEQRAAHLPEQLMTLLEGTSLEMQYLLAWDLIFDHFPTASFKLQEAYSLDIKSSNRIAQLLDFICQKIRITDNKPVDASKFEFHSFTLGQSDSAEQEGLALAIHIYYNCLFFLPSLTKDWYIEQKKRIKLPLESWTLKHISPSIISASLNTVSTWADSQPKDGEKPLEVKVNLRASELVASIPIDPENPPISIAITLPGSYPLESPQVTGRTRVGVSEKNWQSWLRTLQIIVYSSGGIIEGLVAFRRNVQLALKGQSECAICYSIIGTDMQTPSKKCGTCKNTFHGSCLFRWFKSSNSSSCPLCRNNFNYA